MDPLNLSGYEANTPTEGSWAGLQAASGSLALAIMLSAGADAALAGAVGVFVTAASRGVLIAVATVWKWIARKLEGQPPKPPGP